MNMFKFDWTLNVGNLLSALALVIAGVLAWFKMQEDVHILQYQYYSVEKKIEEVKKNQEDNKQAITRDLSDLRNYLFTNPPPKTRS